MERNQRLFKAVDDARPDYLGWPELSSAHLHARSAPGPSVPSGAGERSGPDSGVGPTHEDPRLEHPMRLAPDGPFETCAPTRHGRPWPALLLAIVAGGLLFGCNPLHTATRPDSISPGIEQTAWSRTGGNAGSLDRWWLRFDDQGLTETIGSLHTQNLDLGQAWSRLAQLRAAQTSAGSARWPSVDATGSVTRGRGYDFLGNAQTTTQYGVSVGAAYELDVWQKLASRERAAAYEYGAARHDLEALAMSLTAQTANLWFDLAELRSTDALIRRQIETNQTELDLIRYRYGHGLAQATAVLQQEQQLHATKGLLPMVAGRIETTRNQLALLLGRPPSSAQQIAATSASLPSPEALPALGVPAEILAQRPDIIAARLRVAASDERIGAALADRLPSFRLQASVGAGAQSFTELLDRWIWSLASSMVAPLFDGGRRAAEVKRAEAATAGLLKGFQLAYLRALNEVEGALVLEQRERERLEHAKTELAVAQSLLKETRVRYLEGLTGYLPVLNALKSVQRIERNVLTGERAVLRHRVQLYRALGGTWSRSLKTPDEESKG